MPPTPPSPNTPGAKPRDTHREQVERVRQSLRAGVIYARPGRVGKPGKQR